jgi:hypothetical protein
MAVAGPQLSLSLWSKFVSPELEQIRRQAEQVTRSFSPQQWRCAREGKWSCGQILEHLRLSYTATTAGLQKVMASGKPLASKPTFQERLKTFVVVGAGYLPSGRKATKFLTPGEGRVLDSLRPFNDALVAMDASLTDAEKRFGSKLKLLEHPVIGPLNVQQWRRFHRVHGRLHLKQMSKRAREAAFLEPTEPSFTRTNSDTTATRAGR